MSSYFVSPILLPQYDNFSKQIKARPFWADPEYQGTPRAKFLSTLRKRKTYYPDGQLKHLEDSIEFDKNNRPLYPDIPFNNKFYGRGVLGKWGPNHAADPVLIRSMCTWGRFLPRYFMLVVQRVDTGQWALAGGMVDPGEDYTETVVRELHEEAVEVSDGLIESFMKDKRNQMVLYKGINFSDPRNTYNAWMETCVVMFMIPTRLSRKMRLRPQEGETKQVKWLNLQESDLSLLYSDHGKYADMAREKLGIRQSEKKSTLVFLEENESKFSGLWVALVFFVSYYYVYNTISDYSTYSNTTFSSTTFSNTTFCELL